MTTVPILETDRLILRGWQQSDAQGMIALGADVELMRYVGGAMDPTNAWRRMATYAGHWVLKGYGSFAVEAKATGAFIGYCGVYDPDGWPEREINWGVVRAALGKGYASEAARRVRAYAYDDLGLATITSCIDRDNGASEAVAKRVGATLDRTVTFRGRPVGVWRHLAPVDCRRERGVV